MGGVLCQEDPNDEIALEAEKKEMQGEPCAFDKALSPTALRLRPIEFISRRCTTREASWHSYRGETETGKWAFRKWKRYLLGPPFTWMTDCSGVQQLFEMEEASNHTLQRTKQELLRYDFTIVHRPE